MGSRLLRDTTGLASFNGVAFCILTIHLHKPALHHEADMPSQKSPDAGGIEDHERQYGSGPGRLMTEEELDTK